MGSVARFNQQSPSDMIEAIQIPNDGSQAPSGRVHPLVRPDCAGWWAWYEGSEMLEPGEDRDYALQHHVPRMILIGNGGTHVVDDDEWEQIMGKSPDEDGWTENYWAGTETTQHMMPGVWLRPNDKDLARRALDSE